jgi:hypothetical protein
VWFCHWRLRGNVAERMHAFLRARATEARGGRGHTPGQRGVRDDPADTNAIPVNRNPPLCVLRGELRRPDGPQQTVRQILLLWMRPPRSAWRHRLPQLHAITEALKKGLDDPSRSVSSAAKRFLFEAILNLTLPDRRRFTSADDGAVNSNNDTAVIETFGLYSVGNDTWNDNFCSPIVCNSASGSGVPIFFAPFRKIAVKVTNLGANNSDFFLRVKEHPSNIAVGAMLGGAPNWFDSKVDFSLGPFETRIIDDLVIAPTSRGSAGKLAVELYWDGTLSNT